MSGLVLALLAGSLVAISPCVLPILPIIAGSAFSQNRFGPLALGSGLGLGFAGIGIALGLLGFAAGLDQDLLRTIGSLVMLTAALLLLVPALGDRFAVAAEGLVAPLANRTASFRAKGVGGQFLLGLLLSAMWAPCTGPVLGGAVALASQADTAPEAAATMAVFATGAMVPLIALAYLLRGRAKVMRAKLHQASGLGRRLLGIVLLGVGLFVLSGLDKTLEAAIVRALPESWVAFTTSL